MPQTYAERKKKYIEKLKEKGAYEEYKRKRADQEAQRKIRLKEAMSKMTDAKRAQLQTDNKIKNRKRVAKYRRNKKGTVPEVTREKKIVSQQNNEHKPKINFAHSYKTPSALSKAVAKMKKSLPTSPSKRKAVIAKYLYSFSAQDRNDIIGSNIIHNSPPAKRKTKMGLSSSLIKLIQDFYERDDISRLSPNVKDSKKIVNPVTGKKELHQLRFLSYTLAKVYNKFAEENTGELNHAPVKRSKFCALRPQHVKLIGETPRNVCFCIYHSNFIQCCDALHKHIPRIPKYGDELVQLLVCKKATRACFFKTCKGCAAIDIKRKFEDLLTSAHLFSPQEVDEEENGDEGGEEHEGSEKNECEDDDEADEELEGFVGNECEEEDEEDEDHEESEEIESEEEEDEDVEDEGSEEAECDEKEENKKSVEQKIVKWLQWKKDKIANRFQNKNEEGTLKQLIHYFLSIYPKFLRHHHIKREQHISFNLDRKSVDSKENVEEAVLQIDFAENYKCKSQNEIQQAHYNQKQISLFTSALHHASITYSKVVASDNTKHTKETLVAYLYSILSKLPSRVKRLKIWSDGPTSQFKNRFIAAMIIVFEKKFKIKIYWNFFATAHGKACIDGVGATVKREVKDLVLSNEAIVNGTTDFVNAYTTKKSLIKVVELTFQDIEKINAELKLSEIFASAPNIRDIVKFHHLHVANNRIIGYFTSNDGYGDLHEKK